jgi:hypothetical protein
MKQLNTNFSDRIANAEAAKKARLAAFKPKPTVQAEEVIDRAAEREAELERVRAERAAAKEAQRAAQAERKAAEAAAKRSAIKERKAAAAAEQRARREAKLAERMGGRLG